MKERTVRKDARSYFVPFLLGSNRLSRRISARIFRKYGIVSYIASPRRSLWDILCLTGRALTLSSEQADIICQELISLGTMEPYTLPLLIITDKRYEALLEKHKTILEQHFVICSHESLFSSSPLADLG